MTLVSEHIEPDTRERILVVAERLFREIGYQVTTVHRMNCERYVGDSKLHEMVEIAMEESWEVCLPHMQRITGTIAAVIADGAASGEFEAPDVPLAAMCACTAMMRFFHPQMIAQCANKPGPSLDQMIDFVLAGLAPRGAR